MTGWIQCQRCSGYVRQADPTSRPGAVKCTTCGAIVSSGADAAIRSDQATPGTNPFVTEGPDGSDRPPRMPASRLGIVVMVLLTMSIGVNLVMVALEATSSWLIEQGKQGAAIDETMGTMTDGAIGLTGLVDLALTLVTGICFLTWVYSSTRNLQRFGRKQLKLSPGWAVGCFFIPVASMVYFYQAMQQLYRGSTAPLTGHRAEHWKREDGALIIGLWWCAYLLMGTFGYASFRLAMHQHPTPETEQLSNHLSLASNLTSVVAAALGVMMVGTIRWHQLRRYDELLELHGQPTLPDEPALLS